MGELKVFSFLKKGNISWYLNIMNDLKNRGVQDILIACIDGLAGFPQAIEAVFPQTEVQHCIIHQIRNSTRFVSYKDIKALMADLKRVYATATEDIALNELDVFAEKWNQKYPKIHKSWANTQKCSKNIPLLLIGKNLRKEIRR